jgi:hypothetical protein
VDFEIHDIGTMIPGREPESILIIMHSSVTFLENAFLDGDLKRKPPKVIIKFVFASINLYSQDFGISRILEAESRKLSLASLTPLSKNLKLKK